MGPKDDGAGALMGVGYWKKSESDTQTDSEMNEWMDDKLTTVE